MRWENTLVVLLLGTGMFVCPLQAQTSLEADTVSDTSRRLDDVTVTARRKPHKLSAAAPVQSLSGQDLEQLGIRDMADAVRRFAGVNVRDYGGIGGLKTVSVRNMGAAHTAVSYDGLVVSNTQAGQIDIGRFALDNVAVLSLSIGQSDELLQSARHYASAGVLNIETEKPHFEHHRTHAFRVLLRGGSFGYLSPYLRWWQALGKRTTLAAEGNFTRADSRYPFTLVNGKYVTEEKRHNSAVSSGQGEVNLRHTFNDESALEAKGYFYRSSRGLPGAIILYNPESHEHLWDKNAFAQVRYRKQWSTRWSLQAQAKYNYSWNKYFDKGTEYADGTVTDRYKQNEYYLSATVLYKPAQGLNVVLAQDAAINTLDSSLPECPFPTRVTSLTALRAQYRPNERFLIDASLLGTYLTEHVKSGERPDDLKRLSPSVGLSYRPCEAQLYLRAFYKSTFRTPTFNDLYYYRMGNRSLRPEKSEEFNVGLTWGMKRHGMLEYLSATVDGYFHQVTDKIVAFPSTYVWRMANFGKAHISGTDVSVAARLSYEKTALTLNGSYSWQKAIDLTDPTAKNYRQQLPYTPRHNGSASAQLELPWFSIGYSLIGMGKRYYLAQNLPENEIGRYTEHSVSLARQFAFKRYKLQLRADVQNIANRQYEIIKYYPMPGCSWRLTAGIDF